MALVQPFANSLTLCGTVVGLPTLEAGRRGEEGRRGEGRRGEGRRGGGKDGS